MSPIESVINIALLFFIVLVSATLIERMLEFLTILLDFLDPFIRLHRVYWGLAEFVKRRMEKNLRQAQAVGRKEMKLVMNVIKTTVFKANIQAGEPVVIRVDLIRKALMIAIIQGLGIFIGVWLAFGIRIDIFKMMNQLGVTEFHVNPFWGKAVTGVLIGSGTGPIHSMIKYVEGKKDGQKRQVEIARLKASLK
jgi:hypothetical protein